MLTKTDFTNLRNEFATKKDLKKFVTNTEFRYEINRLDKRIDDFHKEFVEFKDTVLQTLDWLVGAFKDFKYSLQGIRIYTTDWTIMKLGSQSLKRKQTNR